VLDISQSLFP